MSESNLDHTQASEHPCDRTEATELTYGDREIAVKAICARATGTTTEAAAQILAGIAVLDGLRFPILLWPEDVTREEKAAWHDKEADFWRESAKRFSEVMSSTRSDQRSQETLPDILRSFSPDLPQQHSALAAPAHCVEQEENPSRLVLGEPAPGSSDAC